MRDSDSKKDHRLKIATADHLAKQGAPCGLPCSQALEAGPGGGLVDIHTIHYSADYLPILGRLGILSFYTSINKTSSHT